MRIKEELSFLFEAINQSTLIMMILVFQYLFQNNMFVLFKV